MNERIVSLLGALLALVLVVQLLIPQHPDPEKLVSFPTTENRGKHGLWVLYEWLQQNNVQTLSLRNRIDSIADIPDMASTGNIMIISLPTRSAYRQSERSYLTEWIAAGNTILIFAGMNDAPVWTRYHYEGTENILEIAELDYAYLEQSDDEDSTIEGDMDTPRFSEFLDKIQQPDIDITVDTKQHHTLFTDIDFLSLEKNQLSSFSGLENNSAHEVLIPFLYKDEHSNAALWLKSLKDGEVWFFTHADVVNNVRIKHRQNAQFISNFIALNLAKNGTVIFDDFHQGLTDIYDPEAFFNDPRLHTSLWFIVIFWLIYIVGHNSRFGPLETNKPTYNSLNFVSALGNFIARQCSNKTVAKELLHHFNNEVRKQRSLPANNQAVWHILEDSSAISRTLLDDFKRQCLDIENNKRFNLKQFYNQLQRIRKQL